MPYWDTNGVGGGMTDITIAHQNGKFALSVDGATRSVEDEAALLLRRSPINFHAALE